MSLVTLREVLADAQARGYAVGAFNVHSLDMLPPVVEAAAEERAPVILQFTESSLRFCGAANVGLLARDLARRAPVPVVIHYDHGASPELAVGALQVGFTSVMFDGSKLPLAENIRLTRETVTAARRAGASVEAELGRVAGREEHVTVEGREAAFTDPEEAARFVRETGIDALAVAVGTVHGWYKWEPNLDHDRLARIRDLTAVPLVLHGGSGVPEAEIRRAIAGGICKINVATEAKDAWAAALRRTLAADPNLDDPRQILLPSREGALAVIRQKLRLFGSAGKA
jgi:fructose-bisphosphate aldolase, class II